jgi:N-acyl-D-aspartate/D-glutamate deacylase
MPGPDNFGRAKELLKLCEEARLRGLDVTVDNDTYLLDDMWAIALLPDWAVEGGKEKIPERLRGSKIREEIKRDTMEKGSESGGSVCRSLIKNGRWDLIWLGVAQRNQEFSGKTFPEIAKLKELKDPFDVLFDILIEEEGKVMCNVQHKLQEDIDGILCYPYSMLITDGKCVAPYGPLKNMRMPRFYGTFPRFLGRYVRERGLLRLEEAIRKITSLPAQRMKLGDRGLIKGGMWADITIFNPKSIIDTATFSDPQRYPESIEYVLVDGHVVIERGEHTGILPGKVLRHDVDL